MLTLKHFLMRVVANFIFHFTEEQEWVSNVVFHRAYKSGQAAQVLPAKALFVYRGWAPPETKKPDYTLDFGFMSIEKRNTGGCIEFEINSNETSAIAMGYPSNIAKGEIMQKVECQVEFVKTQEGMRRIMRDTPFYKGSSGGAWLKKSMILLNIK